MPDFPSFWGFDQFIVTRCEVPSVEQTSLQSRKLLIANNLASIALSYLAGQYYRMQGSRLGKNVDVFFSLTQCVSAL